MGTRPIVQSAADAQYKQIGQDLLAKADGRGKPTRASFDSQNHAKILRKFRHDQKRDQSYKRDEENEFPSQIHLDMFFPCAVNFSVVNMANDFVKGSESVEVVKVESNRTHHRLQLASFRSNEEDQG